MGFKDVFDCRLVLFCFFEVGLDFSKGVDDRHFAFAFNVIGSLCQTAGIDLFYFHTRDNLLEKVFIFLLCRKDKNTNGSWQ